MSTLLQMRHDTDPRATLQAIVGDMSHIKVMYHHVLVATYLRPERTQGGIHLPYTVQNEDKYQGKVGLVIAMGPQAFRDDDRNHFEGQRVQIGDWIAFRQSDGWQMNIRTAGNMGERHCRMLADVDIKAILSSPDDLM